MTSSEDYENQKTTTSESESEEFSEENVSTVEESSYNVDQDEEYILLSNDDLLSENTESEPLDGEYFDSSSNEESEESEAAWTDSDENVELKEELEGDAAWLHAEQAPKKIRRATKKIKFKHVRHVFTAKCKIKFFKIFTDVKVLVDSFNLIYFMKTFEDYKTFKIDMFKITDACEFNGNVMFSSSTSSYIKQTTLDGKVTDIKKGTGNIRKMVSDEHLYVLGDKLFAFDKNLSLVNEFSHSFKDVCIACSMVVCLSSDGDIYTFDKELNFKKKHSLPFKFQFRGVWGARDKLVASTDNGIIIFDSDLNEIKSFSTLKESISGLVANNDFIVHGSPYVNSLRILKTDLTYYERFPFSKIRINPISTISIDGDTIYFNDSRYISSLKLQYI